VTTGNGAETRPSRIVHSPARTLTRSLSCSPPCPPAAFTVDLATLARIVRADLDELAELLVVLDLDAEMSMEVVATLHAVGGLLGRVEGKIEAQGPG
jgi:hypothetical protein